MSARHDRGDLAQYQRMRDFDATPEPEGAPRKSGDELSFVVQRHDATRLHFDFRLELDGVLKSWAVPKGPSLVPGEKRLAVEVEDHPLDYGTFEGAIPEGHYGAGHVLIWDRGSWKPIDDPHVGLKKGHLAFELEGERLHGRFDLVRIGKSKARSRKPQWLLLKKKDAFAAKVGSEEVATAASPPDIATVHVQLATLDTVLPKGKGWIFEPKLDGYRAIARLDHGKVSLGSRSGQDWTARFPEIRDAVAELPIESAIFDGEVCALDEEGRPRFQRLQNALSSRSSGELVYFVFDLLFVDGIDIRTRPLLTRKAILASILEGRPRPLSYVSHLEGKEGPKLFDLACKGGLEGVIAKIGDRPHVPSRTREWLKIKCVQRQEVVIVGFTKPKGGRSGFGALLLGIQDDDELRYVGKVGTGFSGKTLETLHEKMLPLAKGGTPPRGAPRSRDATWIEPKLVCEVSFSEWTEGGALRHPVFVGLRDDKKPTEVVRETPRALAKSKGARVGTITITHPDRVIDTSSGITKIDLARYVESVSERLLPHIVKRPLALVRCPEGAQGECFFQKQRMKGMNDAIVAAKAGDQNVLYVEDLDGALALVQFGTIEFHGWGASFPKVNHPNQIVMDLDPDEGLAFDRVVDAARAMREVFASLGLVSFVKTTGGKGLHVVAPLKPKLDFDAVKQLTEAIALRFAQEEPSRFTANMAKKARHGKIFVDYLRNGFGATAIAPYSARARPGAPVAFPIAWRDLTHVDPAEFTVRTVPKLLEKRKDPWREFFDSAKTIPSKIARAIEG